MIFNKPEYGCHWFRREARLLCLLFAKIRLASQNQKGPYENAQSKSESSFMAGDRTGPGRWHLPALESKWHAAIVRAHLSAAGERRES
jgi:hypothetical protein